MPTNQESGPDNAFALPAEGSTTVPLIQGWRDQPEKDFLPAHVRFRANRQFIEVNALLQDAEVFNPVTEFNAPAFQHGDIFEIFLRPLKQSAYLELHIGPAHQTFQLRIPSADVFTATRGTPEPWRAWLITEPCFESRVQVEPALQRWQVVARIPTRAIAEQEVRSGDRWLFSFSRYDYTRGRERPVLSSSSRHREVNFHRQQEWGEFIMP